MIDKILDKVVADIDTLTTLDIASENRSYKPTSTQDYIRVTMIPTEPLQVTIGQNRILRYRGIIQVDVVKRQNTGTNDVTVDAIINYFNTNRFFETSDSQRFTILAAWRNQGITSQDRYTIPVQLRYETYV